MPWGIIASVAGPILGGIIGGNAAENAADTQAAAANNASATQLKMFNIARQDQEPWRRTGMYSLNDLAQLTNIRTGDPLQSPLLRQFRMSDFRQDPGYKFRQSEGEKAINRAASAAGRYDSPRTLKDLMRFNQGTADQEYGDAWNRFNSTQTNQFNRLAAISGLGQTAANQTASGALSTGNSLANIALQSGAAQAAGQVGQANAWGNAIGSAYKNYNNNQAMNWLTGGGYGGGNSYGYVDDGAY